MQIARLVSAFVGIVITVIGVRWVMLGLAFMGSGAVNSGGITLPLGLAGAAIGGVVALIGIAVAGQGLTAWLRADRPQPEVVETGPIAAPVPDRGDRGRPRLDEAGPIAGPISRFVRQGVAAGAVLVLLIPLLRASFDADSLSRTPAPEPGPFTEYYESGETRTVGQYGPDGELQGLIQGWYRSGEPEYERRYAGGRYVGGREWFADGQLRWERKDVTSPGRYQEHLITIWHPNGEMRTQGVVRRDGAYGLHTAWYETGQQACEIDYFASAASDRMRSQGARFWRTARQITWYPNGQMRYRQVGQDDPTSWDEAGNVRGWQSGDEICDVIPYGSLSWDSAPSAL